VSGGDVLSQVFVTDKPGKKYPLVQVSTPISEIDWLEMLFDQMPLDTSVLELHFLDFPEIALEVVQPGEAAAAPTESASPDAPGWPVVFSETFDSNANEWPVGDFENEYHTTVWKLEGGNYRWETAAKQLFDWFVRPEQPSNSDMHVEVDARQISGPEDAAFGLALRSSESGFYYFMISETGYYLFSRVYQGDWVDLIAWTASSAIQPGEVNRLEAIAEGSHFRLLINGQLVDELDDNKNSRGVSGLCIALAGAGDEALFEFDNFVIRAP
jgi:hypothetical protein